MSTNWLLARPLCQANDILSLPALDSEPACTNYTRSNRGNENLAESNGNSRMHAQVHPRPFIEGTTITRYIRPRQFSTIACCTFPLYNHNNNNQASHSAFIAMLEPNLRRSRFSFLLLLLWSWCLCLRRRRERKVWGLCCCRRLRRERHRTRSNGALDFFAAVGFVVKQDVAATAPHGRSDGGEGHVWWDDLAMDS